MMLARWILRLCHGLAAWGEASKEMQRVHKLNEALRGVVAQESAEKAHFSVINYGWVSRRSFIGRSEEGTESEIAKGDAARFLRKEFAKARRQIGQIYLSGGGKKFISLRTKRLHEDTTYVC